MCYNQFMGEVLSLSARAPNGEGYTIHTQLSPAPPQQGTQVYKIPDEPHVIRFDRLEIVDPSLPENHRELAAEGVVGLFLHGQLMDGFWVPKLKCLQDKGVSIAGIVDDYEAMREESIDVIFSCQKGAGFNPKPFDSVSGRPYIYTMMDAARGAVVTYDGFTILALSPQLDAGRIVYEDWADTNPGRLKPF